MSLRRGDIWWVDFGVPRGSAPALRRPGLVLQSNEFNDSRISTVVLVAMTSNVRAAGAVGNVLLPAGTAGLTVASVVNVSQVGTLDRAALLSRVGTLAPDRLAQVEAGLRLVLGL